MQVQIKHDDVDISQYVIEYEREHKICTGIGQLQLTLSLTYPTAINPWDEIKIYENGSFQVKYYVSSVSKSQPDGTIILECQDRSKRLIDYFIPDQYTIDYPSYTGYWIKKFLTEAGVSYSFSVPDTGKLLSNYTTLGLAPAYEQIMTLLQLSGWYMYFDGNGVAKIGTLTSDFSNVKDTFGKADILEISKVTDDKMLRNRAVVWGAFDSVRNDYAYADVSTNTRWNYDRNDLRTMVVSNGNIPNKSSAFGIASMLLKEFSKVTVEKHLAVAGAAGRDLGDVVRVRSNVYNGSGLITTYGVSMSRSGLITNMILDERCPRLFGFFDFGDYVYVGTYGDGVWRKHLQFDPAWYNFSTGLTDLAVTDLHINNEVFSAVTASGGMFYSPDNEGPWQPFVIDSLTSSFEASLELGLGGELPSGVVMTTFSGLMGRATIVDKLTNIIKYGIDTYSGVNYGDYFLMYSGMISSGVMASGVTYSGISSSGFRGWIVEYDPFNFASGVYPISVSGNYDIRVLDLENDGLNDYVSVKAVGTKAIENDGVSWNYGVHRTQPFMTTADANGYAVSPENIPFVEGNLTGMISFSIGNRDPNGLVVYDNELSNEMMVVSIKPVAGFSDQLERVRITRTVVDQDTTNVSYDRKTASAGSVITELGITKIDVDSYRFFYRGSNLFDNPITIKYLDWNATTNVVSPPVTILTTTLETFPDSPTTDGGMKLKGFSTKSVGSKIYHLISYTTGGRFFSGLNPLVQSYHQIYVFTIDMDSATASSKHLTRFFFPQDEESGRYFVHHANIDTGQDVALVQDGTEKPRVLGWFTAVYDEPPASPQTRSVREYLLSGNVDVINFAEIYNNTVVDTIPNRFLGGNVRELQLTANIGTIVVDGSLQDGTTPAHLVFNGATFDIRNGALPDHLIYSKVYPILTTGGKYITKSGGSFYLCDASSLSLEGIINAPPGYTLTKPFSTSLHSLFGEIYFLCTRISDTAGVVIPFLNGAFQVSRKIVGSFNDTIARKGINIGSFFIHEPDYTLIDAQQVATVDYIDMLKPYDNETAFLVLQRDGTDFHIIRKAAKPIRVDISNSAPLLTVLDNDDTFKSHYIFENEILTIHTSHTFGFGSPFFELAAPSGVSDYRYTMLEVPSGVEISSGVMGSGIYSGAEKLLLYTMGSGINFAYTNELASGFVQMYAMPSGLAGRIETSNFCGSGQYVFVTTSGDSPSFYQKDPMSEVFASFSGLPVSRATIIRLDDRF